MTKVTSKYQVTLPKVIKEPFGSQDEISGPEVGIQRRVPARSRTRLEEM